MLEAALLILGAYLWGSVPSTYLAARYLRGIDIREFGSGNVGSANFMAHVGRRTGFLLGASDCLVKGTLSVVVAKLLDQSLGVQAGVGLAAIAGHNWSPYIRFTGGRGVATAIGVVLGFGMIWEFLVLTVVMGLIGRLIFSESAFWTFLSILILPVLAYLFGRPPEVVYMTLGLGLLLLLKRVTANWEPPTREYPLLKVMGYRIMWDRDVPTKAEWTKRRPKSEADGTSRDVEDGILR